VKFNKTKSKQTAKRMIIIINLAVTLSLIHDPIHRHLFWWHRRTIWLY